MPHTAYAMAMFRYVPYDEQGKDQIKTQTLFETAFPEKERPPFSMMLSWNHDTFYGVYDNDSYVALADLIVYQDMIYVFFLAVMEECRGKGYGSQILADLKARFPNKRLFLLAEETGEQYSDNEIRKKRLEFYAKNGFVPTGDVVVEFDVAYLLLCTSGPVSKKEFVAVMTSLIGEENARRFYAHI